MRGSSRTDRRMLYWLARRLYRSRTAQEVDPEDLARLLIVRVDERVGNLLTLQSLIDACREVWPRAELGLLASARSSQVCDQLEHLDRIFKLDKRWFFKSPRRWRELIASLRQASYQVAIDASAWHEFSFTHAALTWYSGAPRRIGYQHSQAIDGSGFHTDLVAPGPRAEYELSQRMRLLQPLGQVMEPPKLRTPLGSQKLERWAGFLDHHRLGPIRIGIWAGSRKLERRWPVPYYVQLGRRLQEDLGAHLVLLWGPGEEGLRDQFAQAMPRGLVVAPATGLDDLAGLMRNLDLVVTNDTGPMHLAVACGTPTLALFASGTASRWGHPYAHVRNLVAPGNSPKEVDVAAAACVQLLRPGVDSPEPSR